jgi:molybdopterin-guanine dinucleotide biosynthesis protein A
MPAENTFSNIAAAILAGGRNTRMGGRNKGLVEIEGVALIRRALDVVRDIFAEVILVTNSPGEFAAYEKDCRIITDVVRNIGPLGGIYSALSNTAGEAVFFVACDMPFLHNGLIRRQADCFNRAGRDAVVPRAGDFAEPLHAIYKKSLKEDMGRFIERNSAGCSIKDFLRAIDVHYWELEDNPFHRRVFSNLNTPEDVKEVKGICTLKGTSK